VQLAQPTISLDHVHISGLASPTFPPTNVLCKQAMQPWASRVLLSQGWFSSGPCSDCKEQADD